MKNKKLTLYDIVMTGLLAAVVFVTTMFLSIRIPTPTGTVMIKLANAFVLLCGLLLGPVRGGLAAGFGSMIFDLMTPEYVPEAWLTFIRFFLMAYLCGLIAHWAGARARKFSRNLVAAVSGALFSTVFYVAQNVIFLMLGGSALGPAFIANIPKFLTSPPNTVIAVVVSLVLLPPLQKAISHTAFGRQTAEAAPKSN
ncbi:MAG: ECF transporter S component [Eubacteriales bacterium]|nr:ECF transporter S component [Eubacteriales bacterium]